jgi:hypothetical protein
MPERLLQLYHRVPRLVVLHQLRAWNAPGPNSLVWPDATDCIPP